MSPQIIAPSIFALFVFLSFASTATYAEESSHESQTNLAFGGKLGIVMASQATEAPFGSDLDASHKAAMTLGGFANISVHETLFTTRKIEFSLHPEIIFVSKGTNLDLDGEKIGAYHLRYIEAPLLARAEVPITSNITPYLLLGPALGILITAELENSRGERTDVKENLEIIDFGLLFGAGISVDVAAIKGALMLEARYDLGLRDTNGTGAGGYVKNRAFSLMLGYQY